MNLSNLKAPDLWPPIGLSTGVDDQISWLNTSVSALRYHPEKFAAALELYRFSRSKPSAVKSELAWDWQWIAINEAAMRIWFLRDAMEILRKKSIPACSIVSSLVDNNEIDRAIGLFDTHFPEFKKMRNAIAHAPGLEMTQKKLVLKDGHYAGPRLKDGDRFELVNEGIRYGMDMNTRTLDLLTEVLVAFWSAFKPVEKAFDERGRSE